MHHANGNVPLYMCTLKAVLKVLINVHDLEIRFNCFFVCPLKMALHFLQEWFLCISVSVTMALPGRLYNFATKPVVFFSNKIEAN